MTSSERARAAQWQGTSIGLTQALTCEGEPVEKEEKENRHWLHSPLLSRGLPLQLPANHALMHPFFGIQFLYTILTQWVWYIGRTIWR